MNVSVGVIFRYGRGRLCVTFLGWLPRRIIRFSSYQDSSAQLVSCGSGYDKQTIEMPYVGVIF